MFMVSFLRLMNNTLQDGYDVFNCLNMLQNVPEILKTLHFGPGDGKLRYYMYNWATRDLTPDEIGLVLL
jgi:glycylpeptide N-tetradecanoyltransferase